MMAQALADGKNFQKIAGIREIRDMFGRQMVSGAFSAAIGYCGNSEFAIL